VGWPHPILRIPQPQLGSRLTLSPWVSNTNSHADEGRPTPNLEHLRQIRAYQVATFVQAECIALRTIAVELLPPFHHVGFAAVFLDQPVNVIHASAAAMRSIPSCIGGTAGRRTHYGPAERGTLGKSLALSSTSIISSNMTTDDAKHRQLSHSVEIIRQ
jgi:hypothetical protein